MAKNEVKSNNFYFLAYKGSHPKTFNIIFITNKA